METRQWLNQSQPQTLVNAVLLTYIHAAFEGLSAITSGSVIYILFVAGLVASGWGIANERKWGWYLGIGLVALELLPFVLSLTGLVGGFLRNPLGILALLFIVARLVLLVHEQSREYVKIWFR